MKAIPGFEKYLIDECGNVYNTTTKKFISRFEACKFGYEGVNLVQTKAEIGRTKSNKKDLHCLILLTFVGPRPKGFHACHLDGNPRNNVLSNLKWVSVKENMSHKKIHGTMASGERNGNSKFSNDDVANLRKEFVRYSPKKNNLTVLAKKYGMNREIARKIVNGELRRNG